MKQSEYKFVYQSRLQEVCGTVLLSAGLVMIALPVIMISYHETHTEYVTRMMEDFFPLAMIAFFVLEPLWSYFGSKIIISWKSTGILHLYSGYATLELGSKTLTLKKGEFDIEKLARRDTWYWNILMDGHKIHLSTVGKMKGFKVIYDTSLSSAMIELEVAGLPTMKRETARDRKKMKKMFSRYGIKTLRIGEASIPMGVSASEAFANTPYYIDYSACISTKGSPLCLCIIRELSNPEQVVGSVSILCEEDGEEAKTESVLSRSLIVDGAVRKQNAEKRNVSG